MNKINWIVFLLIGVMTLQLNAQTNSINGKITAFNKYPLKGVSITTKKSKKTTQTDSLGFFKISCKKKDLVRIELKGFNSQFIKISTTDSLNVNLVYRNDDNSYKSIIENNNLDKNILDYCIENLMVENNNFEMMTTIFEVIQSVYPGANFTSETGSEQVLLDTRGPNSFLAEPYALLVVDGIVVDDISTIQPGQVESVKVLVGNNAAHWGVRGANGAVEIKLKSK